MAKNDSAIIAAADKGAETTAEAGSYSRDPKYAEFFGFTRGSTVFSFDSNGNTVSRKLVWPGEPEIAPVKRKQFQLPFNVNGLKDLPSLPVGLTIVSGGTGVGKSTFIRALSTQIDIVRLLAAEPHDNGDEVATVPTFSTADGALVTAVKESYRNPRLLYAIDSLRAPLFETTGPAGKGGIIMPFFTQLTRVSNALAQAGISIVASVNPMNEDSDYVEAFMTKLSASVPATILLDAYTRSGQIEKFTGTISMRPNRAKMSFVFENTGRREHDQDALLSDIEFEPFNSAAVTNRTPSTLINAINKAN